MSIAIAFFAGYVVATAVGVAYIYFTNEEES